MGELGIAIEVSELSAATKKVFQDEGEWMAKVRVGGDTPTSRLPSERSLRLQPLMLWKDTFASRLVYAVIIHINRVTTCLCIPNID
jgi:hypothetical protein